jgi:hypothetical protein
LELREIHEAALRLIFTLVEKGVNDMIMNEMKQLIPFFQHHLLPSSFIGIATESLLALLPFLENDSGFSFASSMGIHEVIASCIKKFPCNATYQYYLFRVIYVFVRHGYNRLFIKHLGNVNWGICKVGVDVSPLFYVLAELARKYWRLLYRHGIVEHALEMDLEECFENKIAAAWFFAQMMISSADEVRDRIGNGGGLVLICEVMDCWRMNEVGLAFECILKLLDMNSVLYSGIVRENVCLDTFDGIINGLSEDSECKKMGEMIIEKLQYDSDCN